MVKYISPMWSSNIFDYGLSDVGCAGDVRVLNILSYHDFLDKRYCTYYVGFSFSNMFI
jgi:hypothetical protein